MGRDPERRRAGGLALLAAVGLLVAGLASTAHVAAHPTSEVRLEAIERQLREQPSSAVLYLERGQAYRRARQWDAALADFDRALALDPARDEVLVWQAAVHYERGSAAPALPLLDAYLAAHPQSAEARHLRARSLRELGRLDESAAEYERLLALNSSARPDDYVERARVLEAQGHLDEALRGLDQGMQRTGPVAALMLPAVEIEVGRGSYDGAVRRLDQLLLRVPGQSFWLVRRAEILELAGRREEARATFELALASTPARPRPPVALRDLEGRIRAGLLRLAQEGGVAAAQSEGGKLQ